ncbi:MAG: AtpZ/AtpI family protein [Terriglobia bacterium]
MIPKQGKGTELWAQVAYYTSLGFIIPAAAVVGVLMGWELDRVFHTAPVLEVACALLGGLAGLIQLLKVVKKAQESTGMKEDRNRPQ